MDKLNKVVVVAAAAFLLLSVNGDAGDETSKIPTSTIIDAARRFFSLPTVSNSWFLPPSPNLDFRVSSGSSSSNGAVEEEEASTKVKDAVAKSLDKSKTTIQDSAKSAAKTLKHKLSHHLHQPEL